jgi:hypothetical protein
MKSGPASARVGQGVRRPGQPRRILGEHVEQDVGIHQGGVGHLKIRA